MEKYEIVKTLGTGSYGTVYLASLEDGTKCAIKTMMKGNSKRERCFLREAAIMTTLQENEYVVRFHELVEDTGAMHIVMEYAPSGDLLEDVLSSEEGLPEGECARIFAQLVRAVQKVHQLKVLHRDVKPENVFLTEERNVRVGDFGLSTSFAGSPRKDGTKVRAMAGTLEYAAPETLLGLQIYGPEVDVWGLGVVLYVMLTSNYPYWGASQRAVAQAILNDEPQLLPTMSKKVKDLLTQLLDKKAEQRITIEEILAHPWLAHENLREDRRVAGKEVHYRRKWLEFAQEEAAKKSATS